MGTIALSWGKYGGFYVNRRRVCLGWVALTWVPSLEIDELMRAYVERDDVRAVIPAAYESFWERRYNQQHRKVHAMEDEIARLRASLNEIRDAAGRAWQSRHDELFGDLATMCEAIMDHRAHGLDVAQFGDEPEGDSAVNRGSGR